MLKKVSGESGSVSEEDIRPWLDDTLPQLLRQYKTEDVYNVDETGLFYKMTQTNLVSSKGKNAQVGKRQRGKCTGGKKAKGKMHRWVKGKRASDCTCWSKHSWRKLPLLIIGKSKSPHCFCHDKSLPLSTSQSEDDNDSTSPIQVEADEILDELRRLHGLDCGVSFQDFINFDNNVETSGSLNDEEIASMVHEGHATQNDSEEISEDYDEPVHCPTVSEYHLALDVVKRFITCNGKSSHFQAISCFTLFNIKVKKQTRIIEFMK